MSEEPSNQAASSLIRLQSKDHEEILNVIDRLRAEGISNLVDLPQLIVCGDQSSGKSSVLEALSGLEFPRRDNVCTRFATELILRRSSETGVQVTIWPDERHPVSEANRLKAYKSSVTALNQFAAIVDGAANAIGISKKLHFSRDVLRVEVSGPSQPHLTLVDLPGLYHASDEDQNEEGMTLVEELVLSYMKNARSVILAVISAKSDVALQKVSTFTRQIDPAGQRTLGIITKPDTLSKGSPMEEEFLKLAKNEKIRFELGWHVVRNRGFEERSCSSEQRNGLETSLLHHGVWSTLPRPQVGIDSLRFRLSNVLKDHILSQLPKLIEDTEAASVEAQISLGKLGKARQTFAEQRQYLMHGSAKFTTLITAAIDGIYLDSFFGDSTDKTGYEKRIRALVQNRLLNFADDIRMHGEYQQIVENECPHVDGKSQIRRADYVQQVKLRMQRGRGRELPGTFSPWIVGELFFAHARPWSRIVHTYIDEVLKEIHRATTWILQEVLDRRTIRGLLKHRINPELVALGERLRAKADELLRPHQAGHPITYNHQFAETVQGVRDIHAQRAVTAKLRAFLGATYPECQDVQVKITCTMNDLISAISTRTNSDLEEFACSEAIDCMLSYYQVARERIIDDISSLAVEECLLVPLLSIFDSRSVDALSDIAVQDIASEDESTRAERSRLTKKAASLTSALHELQNLNFGDLKVRQDSFSVGSSTDEDGSEGDESDVSSKSSFSAGSLGSHASLVAGVSAKVGGVVEEEEEEEEL